MAQILRQGPRLFCLLALLTIQLVSVLRLNPSQSQNGCSSSKHHICATAENPNEIIPFLTSKRTSPRSLPVDFYSSLCGQNCLTFLSWCVQNLGVAWQGSSCLVSHKATATQRPSGSELEDLLPRGLIHFAGQPGLAIGRRPQFPRLLQALLECPLASSRRNDPGE